MELAWSAYAVTGLLTALITFVIGFFVFFENRNSPIHITFLVFSLTITEWSFFSALHAMVGDPKLSLLLSKICHIGALLIPVFFYYFTQKIIGKNFKVSTIIGFGVAIFLIILNFKTPLFIPGTRSDVGVPYFANAGPDYFILITFFAIYVILSQFVMLREINISHGTRRKHLQYFFYASLISFTIGFFNFLPLYGSTLPPYPYSALCGAIYSALIAYAIARHQLFDIEIFIKKGVVFGLLFGLIYGAVSCLIFFVGYFKTGIPAWILFGLSIALAMLVYDPLRKFLSVLTHQILYQKTTGYLELIQNLTDHLAQVRDIRIISKDIVNFLSDQMALTGAYLFLKESGEDFRLTSHRGSELSFHEMNQKSPIARLMLDHQSPVVISPFDTESTTDSKTRTLLRKHRIETLMPIYIEKELYGILLAGQKKSDEPFRKEDEALLKTLMDESAMLFMSVKLLHDLNRANLELGQRKKMSSLIQLSVGIHHELRSPLHAIAVLSACIFQNASNYHVEDIELLRKDATEMLLDLDRIRNCLRRFSEFARPTTHSELVPVSLKEELDCFFLLMLEGHKLDKINVHNRVSGNIHILAHKSGLQEILFSLLNNAYEAMEGKGILTLEAYEHEDSIDFIMKDSGPGISEEILPRIFEEYFTTKSTAEAAGIGLSIAKHRMELFGGTISASSPKGGGAKFTLKFQKADKETKAT